MPAHSPWKMDCSLGRTITVPQSHGIAKGSGVHRYSCRESPSRRQRPKKPASWRSRSHLRAVNALLFHGGLKPRSHRAESQLWKGGRQYGNWRLDRPLHRVNSDWHTKRSLNGLGFLKRKI